MGRRKQVRRGPPDPLAAATRITQVLASKNTSALRYWTERGRSRFARELEQDGFTPEAAAVLLDRIAADRFRVDLDDVFADLAARQTSEVSSASRQGVTAEDRDGEKAKEHRGPL